MAETAVARSTKAFSEAKNKVNYCHGHRADVISAGISASVVAGPAPAHRSNRRFCSGPAVDDMSSAATITLATSTRFTEYTFVERTSSLWPTLRWACGHAISNSQGLTTLVSTPALPRKACGRDAKFGDVLMSQRRASYQYTTVPPPPPRQQCHSRTFHNHHGCFKVRASNGPPVDCPCATDRQSRRWLITHLGQKLVEQDRIHAALDCAER